MTTTTSAKTAQCPQMSLGRRVLKENNVCTIQELEIEFQGTDKPTDP